MTPVPAQSVGRIYLDCVDEDRCWTMAFRGQLLACSCESELYQRAGDGRIVLYFPDSRCVFVLDAVHELNHYFDMSEREQVMRAIIGPGPARAQGDMDGARSGLWQ